MEFKAEPHMWVAEDGKRYPSKEAAIEASKIYLLAVSLEGIFRKLLRKDSLRQACDLMWLEDMGILKIDWEAVSGGMKEEVVKGEGKEGEDA